MHDNSHHLPSVPTIFKYQKKTMWIMTRCKSSVYKGVHGEKDLHVVDKRRSSRVVDLRGSYNNLLI